MPQCPSLNGSSTAGCPMYVEPLATDDGDVGRKLVKKMAVEG